MSTGNHIEGIALTAIEILETSMWYEGSVYVRMTSKLELAGK